MVPISRSEKNAVREPKVNGELHTSFQWKSDVNLLVIVCRIEVF